MRRSRLLAGRISLSAAAVLMIGGGLACAPTLKAPRESMRLSGTVEDFTPPTAEASGGSTAPAAKAEEPRAPQKFPTLHRLPLGVAVYEACSSQLYFFKRCPGRFLGEAKLVAPGPFLVEIDTQATEVVVFGFRGFLGPEQQQEACAETKVAIGEVAKPITLKLEPGTCSIKLERRYG